MVGWNPDSWVGLRGTRASLPWKCSLNKRRRFGLFVQNLLICFCTVSSTYVEQIWLTLTQKAAVQHVCVCISVQEIPGRNTTNSSWLLPSIYKHCGEIHRLSHFRNQWFKSVFHLYCYFKIWCGVISVLKHLSAPHSDGPWICVHISSSEFSWTTWRKNHWTWYYKLVCCDSEQMCQGRTPVPAFPHLF